MSRMSEFDLQPVVTEVGAHYLRGDGAVVRLLADDHPDTFGETPLVLMDLFDGRTYIERGDGGWARAKANGVIFPETLLRRATEEEIREAKEQGEATRAAQRERLQVRKAG